MIKVFIIENTKGYVKDLKQEIFHEVTLLAKPKWQFENHKGIYNAVKSVLDLNSLEHERNLKKFSYSKKKFGVIMLMTIFCMLLDQTLKKSKLI